MRQNRMCRVTYAGFLFSSLRAPCLPPVLSRTGRPESYGRFKKGETLERPFECARTIPRRQSSNRRGKRVVTAPQKFIDFFRRDDTLRSMDASDPETIRPNDDHSEERREEGSEAFAGTSTSSFSNRVWSDRPTTLTVRDGADHDFSLVHADRSRLGMVGGSGDAGRRLRRHRGHHSGGDRCATRRFSLSLHGVLPRKRASRQPYRCHYRRHGTFIPSASYQKGVRPNTRSERTPKRIKKGERT
jgi:hypothetical protein